MKIGKLKATYDTLDNAKKRLLYWLLVFFIGISVPVFFLLYTLYAQLENETWYQQKYQAELLVERIEQQLLAKLQTEQDRPIAEYSFFNVLENRLLQSTSVNFSPLSELPPKTDIPGLVGYFQIDPQGSFHIPALPDLNADVVSQLPYGLSAEALATRLALKEKLRTLLAYPEPKQQRTDKAEMQVTSLDKDLARTRIIQTSRFDDLSLAEENDAPDTAGRITAPNKAAQKLANLALAKKSKKLSDKQLRQLNIQTSQWKQKRKQNEVSSYKQQSYSRDYRQQGRKETVKIPDQSLAGAVFKRNREKLDSLAQSQKVMPALKAEAVVTNTKNQETSTEEIFPVNILSFESEVSALQMIALNGHYLCFYRNAWNAKSRYIQGFIVNEQFLQSIIKPILDTTESVSLSSLLVAYEGGVLQQFRQSAVDHEWLLFRNTLLSPFQQIELIANTGPLSPRSGQKILDMVSIALVLVIGTGFILFFNLGCRQIELAKQQRNFISSVSHELKTPLTSIRMYSEMLRSNWVEGESQKHSYYDYIFFESERLSRLISNVLQLARLDHQHQKQPLLEVTAKQLLQQIEAKVAAQIEAAHYQLRLVEPSTEQHETRLTIDEDAFFQIMINLVDNAIKFSRQAEIKSIDIGYKISGRGKQLTFYVRDYGPGVEKQRMKKIFRLFYRAGDELTRTQPGTGIGLALVVQLANAMGGRVDLVNRSPGAEFQLRFFLKPENKM